MVAGLLLHAGHGWGRQRQQPVTTLSLHGITAITPANYPGTFLSSPNTRTMASVSLWQ